MQSIRKNLTTIIIIGVTVILAGVALFTALRLYQLRQTTVAPNVPSSQPAAANGSCLLTFRVPGPTSTPAACGQQCNPGSTTACAPGGSCQLVGNEAAHYVCVCATATPTTSASPTASPTPTAVPQCGTTCSTNADCPNSMICSGSVCRNPLCTSSTNCICATATPTAVPTATPTAVPQCGSSCTTNANCPSSMICSAGVCRNPSCTTDTDCICAIATVTTPPATAAPALPNAGVGAPTIIGIATGILLVLGALILVF